MKITELVNKLISSNVKLKVKEGNLVVKLPKDIEPELKHAIVANKEALKTYYESLTKTPAEQEVIKLNDASQPLPLSSSQQALWAIDQTYGSDHYTVPVYLEIAGQFDIVAAEQSLNKIISRHAVLRTRYTQDEQGNPQQVIQAEAKLPVRYDDLRHLTADEQTKQVADLLQQEAQQTFNLSADAPIRCRFVQLPDGEQPKSLLLLTLHHIATDGWSMAILMKEFITLYQAAIQGVQTFMPMPEIQYADYACWQQRDGQAATQAKQLAYWKQQLADLPATHSLPLDSPRETEKNATGKVLLTELDLSVKKGLKTLASQFSMTTFMLLHAALALVLSRHSNRSDIVVGSPVANRRHPQVQDLIGFFVNTLVYRVNTKHAELSEYLQHVKQVHLEAQLNQDVPFERLVNELVETRSLSHTPLFQIILDTDNDYQMETDHQTKIDNLTITPIEQHQVAVKFDLDIALKMTETGVSCCWSYDASLFSDDHIKQLNDDLASVLTYLSQWDGTTAQTLEQLNKTMAKTPVISAPAHSEQTDTFLEQFSAQVINNGNKIAIKCENSNLTYDQLDDRSARLAYWLTSQPGYQSESLVAFEASRSIDAVVAMLGILKAGCAYLPIDPSYPKGRVTYILEDSQARMFLGQSTQFEDLVNHVGVPYININTVVNNEITTVNQQLRPVKPTALAYVIYTSGTTGQPKGVMLEHRNLSHYLTHINTQLSSNIKGAIASTSLSFDATVTAIFAPLASGRCVELLGEGDELFNKLSEKFMDSDQALLFKLTPAHLQVITQQMQGVNNQAHCIVLGGEQIRLDDIDLMREMLPNACFVNEYGPTETTVGSHWKEIGSASTAPISMGKTISNMQGYILDEKANLLPKYAVGELYLTGAGIARGYLNRPELTEARFISNPFYQVGQSLQYKRLYKTGDLCRLLEDGSMSFIGRTDEQVKVNGYRIELEEIAAQLSLSESVQQAVVLVKGKNDRQQLVAFIEPNDEGKQLLAQNSETDVQLLLRQSLAEQLPEYMIPHKFLIMDKWPLTTNGKLDKTQLLANLINPAIIEYQAPETEMEVYINNLWSQVLQLTPEKIGRQGHFFKLGGNSVLMIKMLGSIKKQFSVTTPFNEVFERVTLFEFADYVQHLVDEKQQQTALAEKETQAEGWL